MYHTHRIAGVGGIFASGAREETTLVSVEVRLNGQQRRDIAPKMGSSYAPTQDEHHEGTAT